MAAGSDHQMDTHRTGQLRHTRYWHLHFFAAVIIVGKLVYHQHNRAGNDVFGSLILRLMNFDYALQVTHPASLSRS